MPIWFQVVLIFAAVSTAVLVVERLVRRKAKPQQRLRLVRDKPNAASQPRPTAVRRTAPPSR